MNLTVTIDSVNKTSLVEWSSFRIDDVKDYQPNTCTFRIKKHAGQTYVPAMGDEVNVDDDGTTIFAGQIVRIQNTSEGKLIYYDILVKDWTLLLDRVNVTDRFTSQTVEEVIDYIVTNYLGSDGVTTTNVTAPIDVDTISFQDFAVSKCLQKLAEQLNYHWYIDYDKDIHFFPKHTELAPFSIGDSDGNYIKDSLRVENDLSQLRNKVIIRGAEVESASTRTKTHTADGTQTIFDTSYKFSELPTVTVNSVAQDVGVENLQDEADFDCMWDFNQKYIRFPTAPTATHTVEITQKFLYPLYVQVQDDASIATYGTYEFKKTDKTIKSAGEARQIGTAELEAYAQSITDARFRTRQSGLVSGQTIKVNVTDRDVNEDYMLQRVTLRMEGPDTGIWDVELASLRTIGIIDVLQSLLVNSEKNVEFDEDAVLEKNFVDYQSIQVTEEISVYTPKDDEQDIEVTEDIEQDPFGTGVSPFFVLAPYIPTSQSDHYREGKLDTSMYLYGEDTIEQLLDSNTNFSSSDNVMYGQSFTLTERASVYSVVFKLFYTLGALTGDAWVEIREMTGSVPNSTVLATSDTLDLSTVGSSAADFDFNIDMGMLSQGTYAAVLRVSGLSGGRINVRTQTTDVYAGGTYVYSSNSGSSWLSYPTVDMYFKIFLIV